jgi:hypothetical protein
MDSVLLRCVCEHAGAISVHLALRLSVFISFLTYPRTVFFTLIMLLFNLFLQVSDSRRALASIPFILAVFASVRASFPCTSCVACECFFFFFFLTYPRTVFLHWLCYFFTFFSKFQRAGEHAHRQHPSLVCLRARRRRFRASGVVCECFYFFFWRTLAPCFYADYVTFSPFSSSFR